MDNNFENKDDWFAKEKEREDKISVWDFDEGKTLKLEHEANCEARKIRKENINNYDVNNLKEKITYEKTNRSLLGTLLIGLLFCVQLLVIWLMIKGE